MEDRLSAALYIHPSSGLQSKLPEQSLHQEPSPPPPSFFTATRHPPPSPPAPILAMAAPDVVQVDSPMGPIVLRPLLASDRERNYFALLSQLTEAPPMSAEAFAAYVERVDASHDHVVLVAECLGGAGAVLGSATLLIEHKALRGGAKVGHVEDVVVDEKARGGKVGRRLIERLVQYSKDRGCYKVILDCSEANKGFYERCGFEKKEVQMAQYFKD